MITTYNLKACGDILVIVLAPNADKQQVTTNGQVTRIQDRDTKKTTGFNIVGLGKQLNITLQNGRIFLNKDQITIVNNVIREAGFNDVLVAEASKLVIGRVKSITAHPDSDHLSVTSTAVSDEKVLQIVSGSPNMREGIKVVVAQPGTMMPSGALIWDGALRGVPSSGMIVSGRELQLDGAPDKPGALILPESFGEIGEPFNFDKAKSLYKDGLVDTEY
ncbi:tRNA-binding protein [Leuconostoc gasicomitatum]|uniref:Phenylalanyl-tRNA synthetase domain protein (Bsu YtpR) n=2 Tax=Leuconostoc TaxID=1243 RepID=A0AAN2UEP3_9LACO|nr:MULTISPECIES: DUF4479 and tRNA-binding domain-containing protein [Leuconostoc]MBZ5952819.1 DUF4479 and tRNA-binding domain-containing protein [Leuconostoc gasicomitatum]MBZ5957525.1 DUF4479 and tRNA-binding domain-containing protein [Leuconostoc gasicomitatum]MBZ5970081.1 DUF4479 and tRNA-binding domain-containing protein [Leuconostoc gasicomitatum]MBZ5981130.1 DUF4479 and tRNA-binding domain-containing protein [Leuconostoc gasicomitatum]MBZ5981731.1 DUF4479 and tRNA-binding domain-containi